MTKETLLQIQSNFAAARARGCDCPLVWDHSNKAKDRLGDVESVYVDGERLLAVVSIPSDADREQALKVNQVSVSVAPEWSDGMGNIYRDHLVHVGVVNHPVIPAQEPFRPVELSLLASSEKPQMLKRFAIFGSKVRQLAVGEEPAAGESVVQEVASGTVPTATDATDKDLAPLFRELFDLLGIPGIQLSDAANDQTLLSEVKILLNVARGMKGQSAPEPDESMASVEAVPVEGDYPSIQASLKRLKARCLSLMKSDAERRTAELTARRVEFARKVDSLTHLSAEKKQRLLQIGERDSFDLSLLDVFAQPVVTPNPAVHTSSKVRNLANGGEPAVVPDKETPEQFRERVKRFVS